MFSTTRRQFLGSCSAAIVGAATYRPHSKIIGANEQIRVAVIGFGGRGKALIDGVRRSANARLVALCDADSKVLNGFEPDNHDLWRTGDFREILDSGEVDAIASATPNHWHALMTVWACQAGKHVYMEKPISHNMWESRQVVLASRRFDRIVQAGFQNRSDTALIPFFERLQRGDFGSVQHVHGTCYRDRDGIGKIERPLVIPETINYDRWLGPATDEPLYRPRLHYDWHWDFNTGNGDVGNQGPHEWDLMNWALGDTVEMPSRMVAAGNRFAWNDAGNTPNVMACFGEMNGIPFCFEVVNLKKSASPPQGVGVGVVITTERGTFTGGRGGGKFTFSDGKVEKFSQSPEQKGDSTPDHMQNFFEAILNHSREGQRSEVVSAAKSSAMAHMANISYMLGEVRSEGELGSAFSGHVAASEMLARLREAPRKFAEINELPVGRESWVLGPELTFDNSSQSFVGSASGPANERMTREYRKNYVFPQL